MTKFGLLGMFLFLCFSLAFSDTLVMKDGTTHQGSLISVTSRSVTFREAGAVHRYSRSTIDAIEFGGSSASSGEGNHERVNGGSSSPLSSHRSATLPAGTEISVLTNEAIDSSTANEGQVFPADVAENITNEAGQVVIPKGSEAELVIRRIGKAGSVTGTNDLALDLQSVKVGGRRYVISTEDVAKKGAEGLGKNKRTVEMVGGGAVLGTLIGAIAGGGKGAAIGAATGAAAGAGTEILTRGKTVKVPAESRLRFKLDEPLRLQAAY